MAGSERKSGNSVAAWGVLVAGLVVGGVLALDSDVFSTARIALGLSPGSGPAGSVDPALSPADRQLQAKLQPIIGCINGLDKNMTSLAGAYRDEVEFARGTLAGKKYMMHMNFNLDFDLHPDYLHANPVDDCAKDLDRAVALPPQAAELDAAASGYARILHTMPPVLAEAKPYYKQQDWKDDHFAKGEALDARLGPLFASFEQASDALRTAARTQEDGLRGRLLAGVEAQEGRGARWQSLNVIARARDVQKEADRQAVGGQQFSAKAMQLTVEQLGTAWDEANTYATSHSEVSRAGTSQRRSTWARIGEPASSYLATAKTLRRSMESGAGRETLRSNYQSLLSGFDEFVQAVNSEQ